MKMRLLPIFLCFSLIACATDGTRPSPQVSAEPLPGLTSTTTGFVLMPEEGKKLFFVARLDCPLLCACGATMRIVAIITERSVITKILTHLGKVAAAARL